VIPQPLEYKVVTISRASNTSALQANSMLVVAMNPWASGYYGDPVKECACSHSMITRYSKHL